MLATAQGRTSHRLTFFLCVAPCRASPLHSALPGTPDFSPICRPPSSAQCACRLAALYLDAFSPSCHRLGMPLTAPTAALPMADESGQDPAALRSTGGTAERNPALEVAGTSGSSGFLSHPNGIVAAAGRPAPSSNAGGATSDGVAAAAGPSSAAPGGTESSTISAAGSGVAGTDAAAPAAARAVGAAMEVDGVTSVSKDGASEPLVDLSGGVRPAGDLAGGPDAAGIAVTGGADREAIETATVSAPPPTPPAAASSAPRATATASKDAGIVTPGTADGTSAASLGKRRHSTTHADLVVQTDGDALDAERGGREPPWPAAGGGGKKIVLPSFGFRGVPGADLGPFFRGTALDPRAVRKEGSGGSGSGGSGSGGGGRRGGRLAAIAEGLRRMGTSSARTSAEAAAAEAMAARISDGNATHEVNRGCQRNMWDGVAICRVGKNPEPRMMSQMMLRAQASRAVVRGDEQRPVRTFCSFSLMVLGALPSSRADDFFCRRWTRPLCQHRRASR